MKVIFFAVHPHVSLYPGPHHTIEGSNYTLPSCHVTGYPAPVVSWRKSSGQLPQERVKYSNSALQILHLRKDDSDFYVCSASNLLGRVEKKTLLVVVSPPRFTVKPPATVVAWVGGSLKLNCSASGDPQPVIRWKKQAGQLPVGRSQQINGSLVIREITMSDKGNYICVAVNAGVFKSETVTFTEVKKGLLQVISMVFSTVLNKTRPRNKHQIIRQIRVYDRSRSIHESQVNISHEASLTSYVYEIRPKIKGPFEGCSRRYVSSSKSFLFSLYNINGYVPVKVNITSSHYSNAIYTWSAYGPTFGAGHDLHISDNAANNSYPYTSCGWSYSSPPGYSAYHSSCKFYAGSYNFTPTDVEVFYETTT
ncbi:unnamed protein product [Porites evermanni]|uniref:Ig-like domain-containing protein n=1 Tax=Porites evermanni TaxID=104178 RepID=A0ABN8S5L5_9CNID|nr:unnamed protein product [Porites evermanni]